MVLNQMNPLRVNWLMYSPFFWHYLAFSDNEMILVGGTNGFSGLAPITHVSTVEKYNTDGKLIQTLKSMNIAR